MSQTAIRAFILAIAPESGVYSGVSRGLMDEIASEYWADRSSVLADIYRDIERRGARWGHVFTRYVDAARALPLLEKHLGARIAIVGLSSAYLADVLQPVEEAIEMVLLGHDVVSVGEWSLLQALVDAYPVPHTELVRELKVSSGLVLNRFGLLDTVDADAVRSVERLYRAAAEENRVEPIWDPEEADVESVAVFVEPRFLPPLE